MQDTLTWWPKLETLKLSVIAHVKEEENILFPKYEQELTPKQLEDLATKIENRKKEILSMTEASKRVSEEGSKNLRM